MILYVAARPPAGAAAPFVQEADAQCTRRDDCELQIKGFPGAKHKKFRNQEQATEWLASHGVSESWRIQPVASSSAAPAAPARTATQGRSAPGGSKGKARVAKPEDSKDVIQDTTGWEIVYCDGACRGNGKAGAIAGVGVWWGADDPRYVDMFACSRRFVERALQKHCGAVPRRPDE